MKADNEADAEKQDWPDWQTGGRQVATGGTLVADRWQTGMLAER
jgi:hypothetical protein